MIACVPFELRSSKLTQRILAALPHEIDAIKQARAFAALGQSVRLKPSPRLPWCVDWPVVAINSKGARTP